MANGNKSMFLVVALIIVIVISSSVLGGLAFTGNLPGVSSGAVSKNDTKPDTSVSDEETKAAVSGLDGARLITVGTNSMVVEGSSCSNGTVAFSEEKGVKWIWRLKKIGTYNNKDVYTIESDYKNFDVACDERWLTAPTGCSGPPYLSKREGGPRQSWMIYQSGGGFQIRNLSCVRGRFENSYLLASGNDRNKRPVFTSGGGSTFSLDVPTGGDVL